MVKFRRSVLRRAALALSLLLILPTLWFALRSYGSFQLLHSAYEAGAPETSSIRPWMTLTYVADAYHISVSALIQGLGLPPGTNPNTGLRAAAKQAGQSPFAYVESVQRAVAALVGKSTADDATASSGWLATLSDEVLSQMLIYGYPILGLIVLAGAIGLPLPDGAAAAVAGSLIEQGHMNWIAAGAIVVAASVFADAVGYGIGRWLGRDLLERHGRWLGYTPARGARVQRLFARWGMVTVFLTRTFVSSLSSVASLLAGVSRYRLSEFAAVAVIGRAMWTAAYLGLGYVIGADLDSATGFLGNLTGFLLCGTILVVAALVAGKVGRPQRQVGYTMS